MNEKLEMLNYLILRLCKQDIQKAQALRDMFVKQNVINLVPNDFREIVKKYNDEWHETYENAEMQAVAEHLEESKSE